MASYHVVPDGRIWKVVTETDVTVSQGHRKKQRAIDAMNRAATPGDSKYLHGRDGRIQGEQTHRG